METIHGTVSRILFSNEETGYKVLSIRTISGSPTIVVGEFGPEIIPETPADFHGDFKTHAKYGNQFRANSYHVSDHVEEVASIKLFIDEIAPNIGPERSQYLTDAFGKDLFKVIEEEPERLLEVEGIGKSLSNNLISAWKENKNAWTQNRQVYSLRTFLYSLGLKERRVKKILKHFGSGLAAEEKIRENPYALVEIEGIGFSSADFIARKLGVPESDPNRLEAFLWYLIDRVCPSNGHLYLPINSLHLLANNYCNENGTSFLGKSTVEENDLKKLLENLQNNKRIHIDGSNVYSNKNYVNEHRSASMLVNMMTTKSDLIFLTKEAIAEHILNFERENGLALSKEQKDALYCFADQKVFVITGGPGTGKCLGRNTPVLMFDGSIKKVQDIIAGDILMGDDSTPRKVLSTCSGKEELYRVNQSEGNSYVVNKSHILSLKEFRRKSSKEIRDISVSEYLDLPEKSRQRLKGYRVPVQWPLCDVPIDSYILGFMIGSHQDLGWCSNGLKKDLIKLGILNSWRIPHIYKCNSDNIRLRLLAGLIDSNESFNLIIHSKQLLDDITYIVRSLGFSVSKKLKKNSSNVTYFELSIKGDLSRIPSVRIKGKSNNNSLITSIKLQSLGIGEYYGFEIDGNGRFLLGDFTVTHNTTILKSIVEMTRAKRLNLTCLTPTGISAKKLSMTVDYNAYTIHRRLGYRGNEWLYHENNTFDTDVVITDESSMIDQEVFFRLVSALDKRTHMIIVGDQDQLPSVGAGNVLKELINSGVIPVVKLEKIFRQAEASNIIKAAHRIKSGNTDLSLFSSDPKNDVFFIRMTNPDDIMKLIVQLAQKFKEEKRLFQIITPRNDGPLSVNGLNEELQKILNPESKEPSQINMGKFILRRGDRIMVRKNDYDNDIYNGDIGKITHIGAGRVRFEIDGRTIDLSVEEIGEKIKLAYSISIHKSQGLEYPYIILPFINQFGRNMLQRNLIYTAITRAREKVIVLGHGSAIEKAIQNASVTKRNTKLGERIFKCFQQKKKDSSYKPSLGLEESQNAESPRAPLSFSTDQPSAMDSIYD